jgi:hypothetical protein
MVLALVVYAQLQARVEAEVRAGKPLTVRAHVALCDNSMLACGNARLGDGDSLATNLYWATSEGFAGWFARRGSGWRRIAHDAPAGDVLTREVWSRKVVRRGRSIEVRVEVFAWRGKAIDRAIEAFANDLWKGPAPLVAYIGHDRWMDRDDFEWPRGEPDGIRGAFVLACKTGEYVGPHLRAVPLVLTNDFVFASAPAFERALVRFAEGADPGAVREAAAQGYADGEGKPVARVRSAFRTR